MNDHGSMIVEAHVKLAGLREEQRMKLLTCAREIRNAKNDRQKRRKALEDLNQALRYYEATDVLTERESEELWYALNRGI